MKLLDPTQYGRVRPLFAPLGFNLAVHSILDGNTIGRVYVDEAERPSTALLWTMMDTVMLAGDANRPVVQDALRDLLLHEIRPHAQARGVPGFSIYLAAPAWKAHLPALLPGLTPQPIPRRAFLLDQLQVDWQARLAPGLAVQPMDAHFFTRADLRDIDPALGWVLSFWRTPADFVHRGLGFAVVAGDRVGSWCLSVYVAGNALEFGVETAVAHRGHGWATLAAAACLDACLARGLVAHWHCNLDNAPSVRLAQKLGFTPVRDYTAYWTPFV